MVQRRFAGEFVVVALAVAMVFTMLALHIDSLLLTAAEEQNPETNSNVQSNHKLRHPADLPRLDSIMATALELPQNNNTQANSSKQAYMLYATDARTVCNAIIMARNIRASGTPDDIPIVVLVTNDVPNHILQRLIDAKTVPIQIEPWRRAGVSDPTWVDSLAKLRIFEERGYE
ncbi:hypothetical protein LEN26_009757 [Aphanomyces euteiches]|nr:hypothetical protein LEN26_009757 [Aphanomyces euteiches]